MNNNQTNPFTIPPEILKAYLKHTKEWDDIRLLPNPVEPDNPYQDALKTIIRQREQINDAVRSRRDIPYNQLSYLYTGFQFNNDDKMDSAIQFISFQLYNSYLY